MSIDTEALKARIDPVKFVGQDVELRRIGGEHHGPCPLSCNGGVDRFWVKPDGRWACRRCEAAGSDLIRYVRERDHITFIEACGSCVDGSSDFTPYPWWPRRSVPPWAVARRGGHRGAMTRPPTWLRGFLPVVALQTQALKVAGVQPQGSPTPVKGNDVVHRRGWCEDTSTLHESDMDPLLELHTRLSRCDVASPQPNPVPLSSAPHPPRMLHAKHPPPFHSGLSRRLQREHAYRGIGTCYTAANGVPRGS